MSKDINKASDTTILEMEKAKQEAVIALNNYFIETVDSSVYGDDEVTLKNNHNNHFDFVVSFLENPDMEVLSETVGWVVKSYEAHGFLKEYFLRAIPKWKKELKRLLSDKAYTEVAPLYDWFTKYFENE